MYSVNGFLDPAAYKVYDNALSHILFNVVVSLPAHSLVLEGLEPQSLTSVTPIDLVQMASEAFSRLYASDQGRGEDIWFALAAIDAN